MSELPTVVELPELERAIRIWLTLLYQRRPAVIRDLWTRRGEEHDGQKIEHARREFARFIAEKMLYSHHVTRAATSMDAVDAENRAVAGREQAKD